jgi:hypothetical protein
LVMSLLLHKQNFNYIFFFIKKKKKKKKKPSCPFGLYIVAIILANIAIILANN